MLAEPQETRTRPAILPHFYHTFECRNFNVITVEVCKRGPTAFAEHRGHSASALTGQPQTEPAMSDGTKSGAHISSWLPSSMTRLVGSLKNSIALWALRTIQAKSCSRQIAMPGRLEGMSVWRERK